MTTSSSIQDYPDCSTHVILQKGEVIGMVYAYPVNTSFSTKKINKTEGMSGDAKALKEYYDTHDISIVTDLSTGKLVAKVNKK